MDFKGGNRENRIYIFITFIVLILILFTFIISSNKIIEAYIDDNALGNNWYEDIDERFVDSQLFDLEKHSSFTYRVDTSSYPAFLTVNTYKTLFMMNEKDLYDKTISSINEYMDNKNVTLNHTSYIEGARKLSNGHMTNFIRYNGTMYKNGKSNKIKIVGEAWNCEKSGTSIIVIGYSQVTNNSIYPNKEYLGFWNEIVKKDGLIYNAKCH